MDREILFRGKRLDNGEWVEGYIVKYPSAIQIGDCSPWYISVPPADPDDNGGLYNVNPSTVGQYTGLTDKNGVKIFEGDIMRHYNRDDDPDQYVKGVVFWKADLCQFQRTSDGHPGEWNIAPICRYEVVGNIHDRKDGDKHD